MTDHKHGAAEENFTDPTTGGGTQIISGTVGAVTFPLI
jgi:hypothetical protein